jgi:prepilin-type N-terminal cleavage/methylation domain-containing protein
VTKSTNISATGSSTSLQGGFTLVELLAVVAIMAIVMSVLGLSLRNMQGPSTQIAAAQVASGLSFARQLAISRNAETRFIIYGSPTGTTGAGLPEESWRYWTVAVTNKNIPNPTANMWIMQKEWEKLPEGVVFLDIASGGGYRIINENTIGAAVGSPISRASSFVTNQSGGGTEAWKYYTSFASLNLSSPNSPDTTSLALPQVPVVGFSATGEALKAVGALQPRKLDSHGALGLRLAEGTSLASGDIVLRSINNYYYVETDRLGRIRVRARESYR